MKKSSALRSLLVGLLLVFVGTGSFAFEPGNGVETTVSRLETVQAQTGSSLRELNLNKGNIAMSAGAALAYSTFTGAVVQFDPSIEYFVRDRLSVGITFHSSNSDSSRSFGAGPSLTYHFWRLDNWVAQTGLTVSQRTRRYIGAKIGDEDESVTVGSAKLGVSYFFAQASFDQPAISFGPILTYERNLGGETNGVQGKAAALFQVGVHF